jgi:hypothetical protein
MPSGLSTGRVTRCENAGIAGNNVGDTKDSITRITDRPTATANVPTKALITDIIPVTVLLRICPIWTPVARVTNAIAIYVGLLNYSSHPDRRNNDARISLTRTRVRGVWNSIVVRIRKKAAEEPP